MASLVDEAHCIKLAGMDCLIGILVGFSHLVHAMGELPASGDAGEHNIAVVGEERLGEPVAFARLARNAS